MKDNEKISLLSPLEWSQIRNRYHTTNKGMDLDIATEVLFEVDEILKSLDINYYLTCGTALGFYRDGGFIPWDDEIDIDIFSEIFTPQLHELKSTFIANNFIARATVRGKTSKMAVFKRGIKIAMGAIYYNGQGYRCDLGQKFPSKFFDNPQPFTFNGRAFLLPSPIEEYLTFYYGDWKTPVKSYHIDEYLNPNGQWRK